MLSEHMVKHWAKIGYKPDSAELNEVDEVSGLDIQVGSDKKKPYVSESSLTSKYREVILKGFTPDTSLDNIIEELFKHGLPATRNIDDILRNDKTGHLTVTKLQPANCLELMEKMHAKKFFGRKVFVTSVVSNSPAKGDSGQVPPVSVGAPDDQPTPAVCYDHPNEEVHESDAKSAGILTPALPKLLSPSVKEYTSLPVRSRSMTNLEDFEFEQAQPSTVKQVIANFQLPNKRKALNSPETFENIKKEKKLNKKEIKNKQKCGQSAAKQIVSPTKML